METPENHHCWRCGHVFHDSNLQRWWHGSRRRIVCAECHRDLVEQHFGHRQTHLEFPDQGSSTHPS